VTAAAKRLGVSRVTPSELLNGDSGVTAKMAIGLEKAALGRGFSEVIEMVAQVTAQSVPVEICPRRSGDPPVPRESKLLAVGIIRAGLFVYRARISLSDRRPCLGFRSLRCECRADYDLSTTGAL
jgi:hypothetical protein